MPSLSQNQLNDFLSGTHLLHLAVNTEIVQSPYVVPMWYTYYPDENMFEVIGRPENLWIAYIRKNPRVGYSIAREESPYVRVHGRGYANIMTSGDIGNWWEPLAVRYLGEEKGQAYFQKTKDRPRVIVNIAPMDQQSWAGGEWHKRYLP